MSSKVSHKSSCNSDESSVLPTNDNESSNSLPISNPTVWYSPTNLKQRKSKLQNQTQGFREIKNLNSLSNLLQIIPTQKGKIRQKNYKSRKRYTQIKPQKRLLLQHTAEIYAAQALNDEESCNDSDAAI